MRDEVEKKFQEYRYLQHEEWCDLLSTLEANYESKRASELIKKQSSFSFKVVRETSDSEDIHRVPHKKKKSRTGNKPYHEATYKH